MGSPWSCSSAPGAELGPAPLRLGVSSGEQVFVDPQNRDAVLVPRRGTQIPSGLRTTTAYTVDVQLANGLCYAVRIRFSRFERLHAELLRELPGVPLPPLPQKRGPHLHVRGARLHNLAQGAAKGASDMQVRPAPSAQRLGPAPGGNEVAPVLAASLVATPLPPGA